MCIRDRAICSTSCAQNFFGMKIKKFGYSISSDQDRVNGLDATYFSNLSKDGVSSEIANQDFPTSAIESMTCENSTIRFDITVLPFEKRPDFQLNLGASLMKDRVDGTVYNFNRSALTNYNNVSFSSRSNEFALDGSMLYHKKLTILHFYAGAGTNLGYTFSGEMDIHGKYEKEQPATPRDGLDGETPNPQKELVHFHEHHQMKNSLHQRVFLQAGFSFIFFKRFELGWETRRGIGYRYNKGNPMKFTTLVSSGINLRWNLK